MTNDFPPPPAPATSPYSATDAISYGWKRFQAAPATFLVPALVWLAIVVVVEVVVQVVLRTTLLSTHSCTKDISGFGITVQGVQTQCGPSFFTTMLGTALASFVAGIVLFALSAGLIRLVLNFVDGRPVVVGDMLTVATQPPVLTTAVLVSLGQAIGTLLFFLPGIIFGVLAFFSGYFVVDKGLEPVAAIKASFSFVISNFVPLLLFYILAVIVTFLGAIACCVGLLVAIPVVFIATGYTWRRLNNEPVVG